VASEKLDVNIILDRAQIKQTRNWEDEDSSETEVSEVDEKVDVEKKMIGKGGKERLVDV